MKRHRTALITTTAISASIALALSGVGSSAIAAPAIEGAPEIDIVDTDASSNTNSLYKYLLDQQGEGVLWGHQHDISIGNTFERYNFDDPSVEFPNSDVFAGTGEYPGVIGWDNLILEGMEPPGSVVNPNENAGRGPEYLAEHGAENAAIWAQGMVRAHELGAINTISGHTYNFLDPVGGSGASTRVVSQILPGGDKHEEYNDFLDLMALTADLTETAEGESIPIIYRPFHENNGSWFWWGAAHATTGEFKEIFRYTVEYLRDVKGVDNFLYAFSPNGSFGGDRERYLETYPGDDFVDVLGYDFYEQSEGTDSSAFIDAAVTDLGMMTDVAEERGKIAAFTEFGDLRQIDNTGLTFYTDLLNAIKEDDRAKRIAYMLTWISEQPYPAVDGEPEHGMFDDFIDFYNDPYTVFSSGTTGAYDNDANARPTGTTLRLVSPADGVRVTEPTATVRVAATGDNPDTVTFTAVGATDQKLTLDGRYFIGEWNIGEENLTNRSESITVTATYPDGTTTVFDSAVILGSVPQLPLGVVDDFEGYLDDPALRAAYAVSNAPATEWSLTTDPVGSGEQALEFAYDFTSRDYNGIGKAFEQDWSGFDQLNMWIDPDASNQKLVLQINTGNGESFEAFPGLATDEPYDLEVAFEDFKAKSDGGFPTAEDLTSVTSFYVFINKVGEFGASTIVLDDIMAVSSDTEPTNPTDPTDPTNPTDPADPTEPGGNPGAVGGTDTDPAGDGDDLAFTGVDEGTLVWVAAGGLLLLLVGGGLVMIRRARRESV